MSLSLQKELFRRRWQYLAYAVGLRKSAMRFGSRAIPHNITIFIPDSLGDIAVNASVTAFYKDRYPDIRISLITHPRYTAAGELNPHYDVVHGYGGRYSHIPSGELPHRTQVRIARELTPDMDRLFLCQPSAWCDALSARFTMLESQNRLCGVPAGKRRMPHLRLPDGAAERAAELRSARPGTALYVVPEAYTMSFGQAAGQYLQQVADWCVGHGVTVYCNSAQAIVSDGFCTPVRSLPLPDAVALATQCGAVLSMRSGFSDLVGFCAPDLPHLVQYPVGNYPFSRLSWLQWCSLGGMGVPGAVELARSLATTTEARHEAEQTVAWLLSVPAFANL